MRKFKYKTLYWAVSLTVPLIIMLITEIYKGINYKTFIFLILTATMYLIGVYLIYPILDVIKEFSIIIDKYNNIESEDKLLSNEKKYRAFLSIVSDSRNINRLFTEFKKTLKQVKNGINEFGEETVTYYATNDIEYYFDEDNLIYKNIKSRTLNQITQALTAVGIFGTFLGIVEGVSGLNLENSNTMKDGIAILLTGIKTSFNSSLYGIMFSVILTFILKIMMDITMKKADEFSRIVNTLISPYTEQSALSDVERELKKQTATFEELASNMVEIMAQKFNEGLDENINKLSDNMEKIMVELQYAIAASISSMNKEGTLGTSKEINLLKSSMDEISSKNSELLKTLKLSMNNMKKLALYQESVVKNSSDSTKIINVTAENIRELQLGLAESISNLNAVNKTSTMSLDNIKNSIESLQTSIGQQINVNNSLEVMINKSNTLSESQFKYIERFESLSKVMSDNLTNSHESMGRITADINIYKQAFENIKDSSMEVFNALDNKYKDLNINVERANESFKETVSKIDNDILKRLNKTGETLCLAAEELSKFQESSSKLIEKLDNFAIVEESTQKLWANYENTFKELNSNINDGMMNYTKNVTNGVNNLFIEYDASIASAVISLKKMVELLNDSVESISKSLDKKS